MKFMLLIIMFYSGDRHFIERPMPSMEACLRSVEQSKTTFSVTPQVATKDEGYGVSYICIGN